MKNQMTIQEWGNRSSIGICKQCNDSEGHALFDGLCYNCRHAPTQPRLIATDDLPLFSHTVTTATPRDRLPTAHEGQFDPPEPDAEQFDILADWLTVNEWEPCAWERKIGKVPGYWTDPLSGHWYNFGQAMRIQTERERLLNHPALNQRGISQGESE